VVGEEVGAVGAQSHVEKGIALSRLLQST
jgi:hypothetical protein